MLKKLDLLAATLVAAGSLGVTAAQASAGSDDASARQTLVGVAASAPQFSTLLELVTQGGLASALSGTKQLTVFAPPNAAFAKVPKATLAALATDKALLRKVLLYRVVRGKVAAAKVVKLASVGTLARARITAVRSESLNLNRTTKVTKTDIGLEGRDPRREEGAPAAELAARSARERDDGKRETDASPSTASRRRARRAAASGPCASAAASPA